MRRVCEGMTLFYHLFLPVTLRRSRRVYWGDSSGHLAPQNDRIRRSPEPQPWAIALSRSPEPKPWAEALSQSPEPKPWASAKGLRRVSEGSAKDLRRNFLRKRYGILRSLMLPQNDTLYDILFYLSPWGEASGWQFDGHSVGLNVLKNLSLFSGYGKKDKILHSATALFRMIKRTVKPYKYSLLAWIIFIWETKSSFFSSARFFM